MKNRIKKAVATYEQRNQHKVPDRNFMTPNFIEFYFIPHTKGKAQMLVELSEGTGLDDSPIYGVTCSNNGESYHELSVCLHSEDEVVKYINNLK